MEWTDGNAYRYSRNILVEEIGEAGQEKLFRSSALVVGAGGLGSPALLYLAAAGIGRLGVIDADRVDLSNLNRQVIHGEADVGKMKVESAFERLRAFRSDLAVDRHPFALTPENAMEIVGRYDVVVDGSDNFPTKYLLSDAAVASGVPLVHAGALRFGGQILTIVPGIGPCLRCLVPDIPARKDSPTCAEAGIAGAAAGVVGSWQAIEAIKLLTGADGRPGGRLVVIDTLRGNVSTVDVPRDTECPACGASPRIGVPLRPAEYDIERSCAT